MTDAPTPPAPGEMTVPLLSGWEGVATVLLLVLALVALAALAGALRGSRGARPEWQAWLDGRPRRGGDAVPGPAEPPG